jgi:hypothetical protein
MLLVYLTIIHTLYSFSFQQFTNVEHVNLKDSFLRLKILKGKGLW